MATSKATCLSCRLPKAENHCGICESDLCRNCAERLSEDAFELRKEVPAELKHSIYCPQCFDQVVAPAQAEYADLLEKAKQVGVWTRTYKGNVPVLKKAQTEVSVDNARDRDDVFMRLAFKAVELGYNGLVRAEITSRKQRDHGYQKMVWSGHALPAQVDMEKLEREEFREMHWRVLHHR